MSDLPSALPAPRAGFGERLVALIIDGVIVNVVSWLLYAILGSAGYGLSLALGLGYYAFLEGGPAGQTVGKRAMNIRVIRADGTGDELGWGGAIIRYVCRFISGLPCGLGYLWMLWDKDRMTWHDKLSQTVVVPVASFPVAPGAFGKAPGSAVA